MWVKMKKFIMILLFFFLTVTTSYSEENVVLSSGLGKIKNIEYIDGNNDIIQTQQKLEILILKGELAGETIFINNVLNTGRCSWLPLSLLLPAFQLRQHSHPDRRLRVPDR